ncbi:MAG: GGDEF domain-containing protein [Sulfuricella sp.]|nr:GGDEF domain-containing protein [Sulfuricella sp.]
MVSPKLWLQGLVGRVLTDLSCNEASCLLLPAGHPPLLARKRAVMIISRVRMVAALFAVLTPLWIIIDVLVFNWPVWPLLGAGRVVTSVAFGVLAVSYRESSRMPDAYRALALMFGIPTLFFIYSHPLLSSFETVGAASAIAAGYAFLPFVMVAGLSVFPLTILEGLAFALPVLLAEALVALLQLDLLSWSSHLGAFWLLVLITAVASMSGMSQLGFMMALIRQASHDTLTGAFTRASGEELLDIQFHIAQRNNGPFAVVFIDLDNFKRINDQFGHDAGDRILKGAAAAVSGSLRGGDMLLRWGGEEFVILLPGYDSQAAANLIERLRAAGLGLRPDGAPLTASWGVAERICDGAGNWRQLVEIADQRMYQAKLAGKDRSVGCGRAA